MQKINKYLDKRLEQINAIIKKTPNSFSSETYHQLRVEIKKIRFVVALVQFNDKTFKKKKILQLLDIIFKNAGKVREMDIEKAVLKQYLNFKLFDCYKVKIEEKQQRAKINFFSSIGQIDNSLLDQLHKAILPSLRKTSKRKIEGFLKYQNEIVNKHFKKTSLNTDEWHELRKTLKKVLYTEKILYKKETNKKSLAEEFSDLLGKWHDLCVIIDHLKKEIKSKKIKQQEKLFLEKIILKLIYKSDKYLKEVQFKINTIKGANK